MTTTETPTSAFTLKTHQVQSVNFMTSRSASAIWLDMGGGKSLATLAALQIMRPMGHILVVAPKTIARSTWIDEIEAWDFPIRTKSLLVDENDRQLPVSTRLELFRAIPHEPPTMYFINQELLTQSPLKIQRLVPSVANPGSLSPQAAALLDLARTLGPARREDLLDAFREHAVAAHGGKPPAKTKINAWIRELIDSGAVSYETHVCGTCGGEGLKNRACTDCQFGLVDQLPIDETGGRPTAIWPFPTVIIDESQGFGSHDSKRFRALKTVRPAITRLIELTGTPAANGLEKLWSQIYLLDQGEALGENITAFRDRWFTPKMVPGTNTPSKWIPNPGAEEEIHQAIAHLAMSAQNTDLILPQLTIDDVNVTLTPDLLTAYKEFKRDLVLDIVRTYKDADGNLTQSVESIVAQNQAVLTSKLMQFASGTLYTADPDDPSTQGRYEIIHDKKLEMVEHLVRNNGSEPILIAYHFRSDLEQLRKRLHQSGFDVHTFDGSRQMVRQWNDRQIPVMLLHPASAGHGLNLQEGGSTMIWYTLTHNLEWYLQTNGRLHRMGQNKPVTIHRLLTKGTHDERMPAVLADKKQIQDDLIDAVDSGDATLAALEDEIQNDLNDLWVAERV